MSSATSIDSASKVAASSPDERPDPGLRPWQFFVLAGMLGATATVVVATGQSPASVITLSLTVVSASLVGLGAYRALAPLVLPESIEQPTMIAGRTRAALEREKTLVLRSLKELEFDRAMGKVAQADFDEMSGRLRARALGLMRQLDEGGGYKHDIERELQVRLGSTAPSRTPAAAAVPEAAAVVVDDHACASCGTVNDPDARFCKSCGTKLGEA